MKDKAVGNSEQKGAAMVEAALTMLTLLVLLFAIFEAGRLLFIQQTLNNASREGAKLAVLPQRGTIPGDLPTRGAVNNEVNRFIQAAGINGATIRVNANSGTGSSDVVGSTSLPPVDKNGTPCTWDGTQFVCNGSVSNPQFTKVEVTVQYELISISMFSMLQVNLRGEASMRNETSP
jgi:Flp pilus assembly protein TadG